MSDHDEEQYELYWNCKKCGEGWITKRGWPYSEEEIETKDDQICIPCQDKQKESDEFWNGEQGKTYYNKYGGYDWNNKDS